MPLVDTSRRAWREGAGDAPMGISPEIKMQSARQEDLPGAYAVVVVM
jgi:hypothetical protein